MRPQKTVVHVTHEATHKIGGIGAVLEGLFTCPAYLNAVGRSIIIGPLFSNEVTLNNRLGPDGEVAYSSVDGLVKHPYGCAFQDIEKKFGVAIVYGHRNFHQPHTEVKSRPEIILIDVTRADIHPVNALKAWMYEEFGIESLRYENNWEYEQYVKLGPAALAVLRAIGAADPGHPGLLISHEYMGMPTILAAILDPLQSFKTAFYAHEVATVRNIVENHPGHDTMFYNVMNWAQDRGYFLPEIFGPQDGFFKHVLVRAARHCDNIMAVGDVVARELRFLDPTFGNANIDLTYNGLPAEEITLAQRQASKAKLQQYAVNLIDHCPDYIFTHVSRMALSKALWRDLRVLEHLEKQFRSDGRTAVCFLLSTDTPRRQHDDIYRMEQAWKWPVAHRENFPDLSAGEAAFYTGVQEFNARSRNIKVILVNQFGWDSLSCGQRMPADMEFMDIRKGTDVEFGQSIYEPFGIAQLEALAFGGLCVISSVCGCRGYLEAVVGPNLPPNVIVADYTRLDLPAPNLDTMLKVNQQRRDAVEYAVSAQVAQTILQRLPQNSQQAEELLKTGCEIARRMNWDAACTQYVLPALDHAYLKRRALQIA